MSIALSLFQMIEEEMRRSDLNRVDLVRLKIGEMSAVVPEALEFCFEVVAEGTSVAGAILECDIVPLTGLCRSCRREFPVKDFLFRCPDCRSGEVEVVAGEELCLAELEGE
jgi:hydrogenase nickel incorporation protein HypA/HybF